MATKKKIKKLTFTGWLTTNAEEIARRRERAQLEKMKVSNLNPDEGYFGAFNVQSGNAAQYKVEVRCLESHINTCACPDYQMNQLGTCKHIERVLLVLRKRGVKKFKAASSVGSQCIEIYVDRRAGDRSVKVSFPAQASPSALKVILPYLSDNNTTVSDLACLPVLKKKLHLMIRKRKVRIAHDVDQVVDGVLNQRTKQQDKQEFLAELNANKKKLDGMKFSLYPYQQEGVIHLAFTQRAILADEMGLGKTIQAIAACELLRQRYKIERVLVVATASLKTEWEEQIAKFTNLSSLFISGSLKQRAALYQQPAFFYLTNYEQIRNDAEYINTHLRPDVIIVDEAQRIKNWQTKTAQAVKKLKSRYAFVLTGTPLENKIDDIYSIAQFLDPHIFGPLFRFNRLFYQLNEQGKAIGYKNLDKLYARLAPILLRRRKIDVESELPGRTIKHFFVKMSEEQLLPYEEHQARVARLLRTASHRPLRKEEFEQIQRCLACMRMLCDTPYILDPQCKVSPKLRELEKLLPDLFFTDDTKIIIFSEWKRMLALVRELLEKKSIGTVWHTGSVSQLDRRKAINRFKTDPDCRVFLSTDSGSVGLNLQVASVVINLDLPWNPAKLEQRIARAWRKHQTKTVRVINFVTKDSIEHRMIGLLQQKQKLSHSILHGDMDTNEMDLPSSRQAFLEDLNTLIREAKQPVAEVSKPEKSLADHLDDIRTVLQDKVYRLDAVPVSPQSTVILAVSDSDQNEVQSLINQQLPRAKEGAAYAVNVLDSATVVSIQQLIDTGVLSVNPQAQPIFDQASTGHIQQQQRQKIITQAESLVRKSERPFNMAKLLIEGQFFYEAGQALLNTLILLEEAYVLLNKAPNAEITALKQTLSSLTESDDLSKIDQWYSAVQQIRLVFEQAHPAHL